MSENETPVEQIAIATCAKEGCDEYGRVFQTGKCACCSIKELRDLLVKAEGAMTLFLQEPKGVIAQAGTVAAIEVTAHEIRELLK